MGFEVDKVSLTQLLVQVPTAVGCCQFLFYQWHIFNYLQIILDSGPIIKACYLPTSSVVDVATRQVTGRTYVQIPAGDFPPSQIAYTGSGAQPASYLLVIGLFLRIEANGTSIRPVVSI